MGRHAEAESAARALLATLPQAGESVFLLAYAIHQQGRLDEAIPQYELALRYTPMHPSALNNLGTILRQFGRTEEALVQFRRASEADPGKSWIWSNYASALEDLGHTKEALESLRRAAALAPEETVLQDRLIALANGPETAEDHIDRAAATEAMWRLNPAIADFERMGIALRPYVERICEPNYTSQTLTTDQHGFRHLWKESRAIGYDEFVGTPGPKGIICGASQALEYGLANAHTLQANLTFLETSGAEWFSLAAPISNILQRRLLFELFAPPETKYCIVVSGTVNVLLSLLTTHDRAPYPPLHIVSYEWQKDDVALQGGQDIDKAFAETLVWMKHNITMFAAKCRMLGDCHLLFCQPPVLRGAERR